MTHQPDPATLAADLTALADAATFDDDVLDVLRHAAAALTPTDPAAITTAIAALDAAVAALLDPTTAQLDRVDAMLSDDASQVARDDRARQNDLEEQLVALEHRHDQLARRADQLAHENRPAHVVARARAARDTVADHITGQRAQLQAHRARVAARLTPTAQIPPLLEQLADAVQSTGGRGGASAGPQRSPISLAAAELLGTIQVETRARTGSQLADRIRAWARPPAAWRDAAPSYLIHAAQLAEAWVEQAHAILNPPRRWGRPGACPECGSRTHDIVDTTGQTIAQPVLEFDADADLVRCLGRRKDGQPCTAVWDDRAKLHQLLKVLTEQEQEEKTNRKTARAEQRAGGR